MWWGACVHADGHGVRAGAGRVWVRTSYACMYVWDPVLPRLLG